MLHEFDSEPIFSHLTFLFLVLQSIEQAMYVLTGGLNSLLDEGSSAQFLQTNNFELHNGKTTP